VRLFYLGGLLKWDKAIIPSCLLMNLDKCLYSLPKHLIKTYEFSRVLDKPLANEGKCLSALVKYLRKTY